MGEEFVGQTPHVRSGQLGVGLDAFFRLDLIDDLFKARLGKPHNHIGEHLDKAPVGVVGKALVSGERGQSFRNLTIQAKV